MTHHPQPSPVGVILAAGASSRMGSPKALLPMGGVPLLCKHEAALAARCAEVRVVLGALVDELDRVLSDSTVRVTNADWACTGPRESILLALQGLADDTRVVITPVDVPPVRQDVLAELLGVVEVPAAVGHLGRPGHPVLVRAGRARRLLEAGGTLRDVVGSAPALVESGDDACLRNLNTPEDWVAWSRPP